MLRRVRRFLKKVNILGEGSLSRQREDRPFEVINAGDDYFYARGILPQFSGDDRGVYHVLRCVRIKPGSASIFRERCHDRKLVSEVLANERRDFDRAVWNQALYDGRFGGDSDSATHYLELVYCLPSGACRPIVGWAFDFGDVHPKAWPYQVASRVCQFLTYMLLNDLKDRTFLLPSRPSRMFWHTAIGRVTINVAKNGC